MRIIPLLSWDQVHTGATAWSDDRERIECDVPRGVHLVVNEASISDELLPLDKPWEHHHLGWTQVIDLGDRLRMYYSMGRGTINKPDLLCVAESTDGDTWNKPVLNLTDVGGSTANNVVLKAKGANHSHVFIDPSADESQRFKAWMFSSWWEGAPGEVLDNAEGMRRLNANNAAAKGAKMEPVKLTGAMIGMHSPDGLRWTQYEKPILEEWHDTHNVVAWCPDRQKYVGYFRGFHAGRRAISYADTSDFSKWPATSMLVHGLPFDQPDAQLYSNCYTRYPGVPQLHLMFPAIYHLGDDNVDGELAVSLDGKMWSRHANKPIIRNGGPGELTAGHIYPEPNLIRSKQHGELRLLLRAGTRYHNEWYNDKLRDSAPYRNNVAWAKWPEDRMGGIRADGEGQFTLQMQVCGDRLLANFTTEVDGHIEFELVDRLTWPPIKTAGLAGFTFEKCDDLAGDATHQLVTWNGSGDLSSLKGQRVAVRVRMKRATLYSLTFYGTDEADISEDPRYPV